MMTRTIFETPAVRTFAKWLIGISFKLSGWRLKAQNRASTNGSPSELITLSGWDFPLMLAVAFGFDINVRWMGKDSLFRWPWGLFRYCGGVPVDRSKKQNLVEQSIEQLKTHDRFVIAIAPEGTRKKSTHWKTGFYRIALGAGVPLNMAFLDYERKVAGLGPVLMPSGDIDADFEKIRAFYSTVTAKYPDQVGEIVTSPKQ
ncbi:MAG: 1-acyl-sn-glycerol-3-phosphate acyltransferase [Acidobacteria bacterium]|nr:1-acyl-sn-glycerol-3-phosphate acyltransferase [Acidobacteriota bacterium]